MVTSLETATGSQRDLFLLRGNISLMIVVQAIRHPLGRGSRFAWGLAYQTLTQKKANCRTTDWNGEVIDSIF
jgi:hypothetical protein